MKASDAFWDDLIHRINRGRVVPVVGRDLLVIRDGDDEILLPRLLARKLAEELGVDAAGLPEGDELNAVACRYLEKAGSRQRIYAALNRVFPKDVAIPEPLTKLAQIDGLRLFLTTTFDPLLERALAQERSNGVAALTYSPNDIQDLTGELDPKIRPIVYYLLGKLDLDPTYAVTQEDTLEWMHSLQSKPRQPQRLFDELNRSNLLVLGSHFGGWLARFFMRLSKNDRLVSREAPTDYLVGEQFCGDPALVEFVQRLTRGIEVCEEGAAVAFVDELHRRWQPDSEAEAPSPYPQRGFVFLSYAREDETAAAKLKGALETQVEVFFDKESIEAGEDWEAKLRRCVKDCVLFVPIISRHTIVPGPSYFKYEWSFAADKARMYGGEEFVLPVAIDDVPLDNEVLHEVIRRANITPLPGGEATEAFVNRVKDLYRHYQVT